MDAGLSIVDVDGARFAVHLVAPGGPLEVHLNAAGGPTVAPGALPEARELDGDRVCFPPWRLDDHLGALDRHVHVNEQGVRFDEGGFARELLQGAGVPEALHEALTPLSLWWAAGGATGPRAGSDGFVDLGTARVRLRPWTWAEREGALDASTTTRPDGARELSLARYLRRMVACSVVEVDPSGADLAVLTCAAALLDALAAINVAGDLFEDRLLKARGAESQALSQTTLRLCRALGWTPSQVWAAPAAEIDRLLTLLDVVDAKAAAPRATGLAAYPDAVVIRVEDG